VSVQHDAGALQPWNGCSGLPLRPRRSPRCVLREGREFVAHHRDVGAGVDQDPVGPGAIFGQNRDVGGATDLDRPRGGVDPVWMTARRSRRSRCVPKWWTDVPHEGRADDGDVGAPRLPALAELGQARPLERVLRSDRSRTPEAAHGSIVMVYRVCGRPCLVPVRAPSPSARRAAHLSALRQAAACHRRRLAAAAVVEAPEIDRRAQPGSRPRARLVDVPAAAGGMSTSTAEWRDGDCQRDEDRWRQARPTGPSGPPRWAQLAPPVPGQHEGDEHATHEATSGGQSVRSTPMRPKRATQSRSARRRSSPVRHSSNSQAGSSCDPARRGRVDPKSTVRLGVIGARLGGLRGRLSGGR